MTYGDRSFRYGGDGFQDERPYPPESASGAPVFRPEDDAAYSAAGLPRRVRPADLDDVFDDPQVGDPGMDRMTIHVLLEAVLLAATVGVAALYYMNYRAGITGDGLRGLLLAAATLGFLTLAAGISLQVGVVNLAIGPIMITSAVYLAGHPYQGSVQAAGTAVALAGAVGGVIGLLTVTLHVPSWATSLAGALGLIVWIQKHPVPAAPPFGYQPARHAFYWYGGFAALVLLGGFLSLVKPLRRNLGRYRPIGDPALRRGTTAAVIVVVASVAAGLLAGVAGVLGLLAGVSLPADGFAITGLAVAAALVGGTSAFGRRSGIFGLLLAATLLALVRGYGRVAGLRISDYALAAAGIVLGVVVTRLVERYGHPRAARTPGEGDEDSWGDPDRLDESLTPGYPPVRQGGWTSQLPARNNDDTWGGALDGRWGAR